MRQENTEEQKNMGQTSVKTAALPVADRARVPAANEAKALREEICWKGEEEKEREYVVERKEEEEKRPDF